MLFDISKAGIEVLNDDLFIQKQVSLSVLRLDKIHPVVSGNKLFKLHYFLDEAIQSSHPTGSCGKTILTFGGAYSNHLAATAFGCASLKIKSIAIVRGEQPAQLSLPLPGPSFSSLLWLRCVHSFAVLDWPGSLRLRELSWT